MFSHHLFRCKSGLMIAGLLAIVLSCPNDNLLAGLTPTPFQYTYGSHCYESGFNGVQAIRHCDNDGYIYVGTTDYSSPTACDSRDIYVVRMNSNGTSLWERTYDIADAGGVDEASDLVECQDGSGFLITGTTDLGGTNTDIFILKIDCNGAELWTNTYGAAFEEWSASIIETRSSMDVINPTHNDIVVVGFTASQANATPDAYIFRTRRDGVLLWDAAYREGGIINNDFESFMAVTEATPAPIPGSNPPQVQAFGDIVAVGYRELPGAAKDGYVVRVDGFNGQINPAQPLQRSATFSMCITDCHGGLICGDEMLMSVIELQNPAQTGGAFATPNIVIGGFTTSMNSSEILMIKLIGGDPCDYASAIFGDGPITCTPTNEAAYEVREIDFNMPGNINQWDLVITGYTDRPAGPGSGDSEAFICTLDPTTMYPTSGAPLFRGFTKAYGQVGDNEDSYSIDVVPAGTCRFPGFVIGGNYSATSPGGSVNDLYIVKTLQDGRSAYPTSQPACERDFLFQASPISPLMACGDPVHWRVQFWNTHQTQLFGSPDWGFNICPYPKQAVAPSEQQQPSPDILSVYPNPVGNDETLTIGFNLSSESELRLRIVNSIGVEVFSTRIADRSAAMLNVNTEGWAAGAYIVELHSGDQHHSASFIVGK